MYQSSEEIHYYTYVLGTETFHTRIIRAKYEDREWERWRIEMFKPTIGLRNGESVETYAPKWRTNHDYPTFETQQEALNYLELLHTYRLRARPERSAKG